ncbi:MAG: pentapeptide repeat-containing protein [Sphingobacteriia bacterium]|nr:pentapeptide repeat-containing protein [Sphingobacteriia bacterium]
MEQRKKANLLRDHLDVLITAYNEEDDLIRNMLSEDNKLDLSNFNIVDQDLREVNFSNCILKNCNFKRSKFDNNSIKEIINRASSDHLLIEGIDLSSTDLSSKTIYERALGDKVNIPYYFKGLMLDKSSFENSDLTNANFDETSLKYVNFSYANLTGATFIKSDIFQANFTDAIFFPNQLALSTNFNQAIFSEPKIIDEILECYNEIINPDNPLIKFMKDIIRWNKFAIKNMLIKFINKRKISAKSQRPVQASANIENQTVQFQNYVADKSFVDSVQAKSNNTDKIIKK